MLDAELQKINSGNSVPPIALVQGLANVISTIEQRIALLAQDEANGEMVKQMSDALGKAANFVQAYIKQIQQQQQAMAEQGQQGGGMDPEVQAKVQARRLERRLPGRPAADPEGPEEFPTEQSQWLRRVLRWGPCFIFAWVLRVQVLHLGSAAAAS